MRLGLFILSVIGFVAATLELSAGFSAGFSGDYSNNHIIYLFLLGVLICNCAVGIAMTFPQFSGKRRLKSSPGRYAIKK